MKRLEELGIGRPSTYASIMQTIQDRGYVWKKGTALVPTWTAFAVVNLLEQHFADLVDYSFTARMEDDLDEIAARHVEREPWLHRFWFGQTDNGARPVSRSWSTVASTRSTPPRSTSIPIGVDADGNVIVVKPGRYGPYVKRGDDTASVPDDIAPDELTVDKAIELPVGAEGRPRARRRPRDRAHRVRQDRPLRPLRAARRARRRLEGEAEDGVAVQDMDLDTITLDDALRLLSLPRVVGTDPDRRGDHRAERPLRAVPQARAPTAAASSTRSSSSRSPSTRRCASSPSPSAGAGQRATAPLKELGDDPVSQEADGGEGRPLRPLRHRRRDQRVAAPATTASRPSPSSGRPSCCGPPRPRARPRRRRRRPRRPPRRRRPRRRPRPRRPPPRRPDRPVRERHPLTSRRESSGIVLGCGVRQAEQR